MKIDLLNSIIETHFQFQKQHPKEKSVLFYEISKALNCSLSHAITLAATHCNMVSMYAIFRASGAYEKNYSDFLKLMIDEKMCNDKGYIDSKEKMLEVIGSKSELETFRELEDIINPIRLDSRKFYQVKIKGDTSGDHFMACYVRNNILYLSDTSYRGIGRVAVDYIYAKNFQKITEVN